MTVSETTREMMAKAIHESHGGVLPWEKLPASPQNPQRVYAYRAADAVIALFSPGRKLVGDVATALAGEPAVDRCPKCGHKPHGPVCFNMASDNDCDRRWAEESA